jgi:hypothetical protein
MTPSRTGDDLFGQYMRCDSCGARETIARRFGSASARWARRIISRMRGMLLAKPGARSRPRPHPPDGRRSRRRGAKRRPKRNSDERLGEGPLNVRFPPSGSLSLSSRVRLPSRGTSAKRFAGRKGSLSHDEVTPNPDARFIRLVARLESSCTIHATIFPLTTSGHSKTRPGPTYRCE